uniref:RING-type domain-containing protein n=1 Tax=Anopheles minimus TaxID=112268 RepID=A0A182WEJ9_9DIPT
MKPSQMEHKTIQVAAASDVGATEMITYKHSLDGMRSFGNSCHLTQSTASNVIEPLNGSTIDSFTTGTNQMEEKESCTNSAVCELSDLAAALPPIPQITERTSEEKIELNTEAVEELSDDEDKEDVIVERSAESSASDIEDDEELEEAQLLPCNETDANCLFAECDVHREECEICHKHCLVPGDAEQRRIHAIGCTKFHITELESASDLQESYDKTCSICFEIVMNKRPREQRFGILSKCQHVFCLKCIRNWRKTDNIPQKVRRSCPATTPKKEGYD